MFGEARLPPPHSESVTTQISEQQIYQEIMDKIAIIEDFKNSYLDLKKRSWFLKAPLLACKNKS